MAASMVGRTAFQAPDPVRINLALGGLPLSRGCNVVFADLSLRREAHELINAHKGPSDGTKAQAVFRRVDVSSWKDLSDAYTTTKAQFGSVDILCPGAWVFEPSWSNFWRPPETYPGAADSLTRNGYKSIDINLIHPIRLTQSAIIDHLQELKTSQGATRRSQKAIVHISSVNGQVAPLWSPLYNAAKHPLIGFVRTMAPLENRLGIRVIAVAPGLVKAPMWSDGWDKTRPLSQNPAWVTAEEAAQAMLIITEKSQISSLIRAAGEEEDEHIIPVNGGSIIEVSGDRARDVKAFFDPGPQGISSKGFDVAKMEETVLTQLREL